MTITYVFLRKLVFALSNGAWKLIPVCVILLFLLRDRRRAAVCLAAAILTILPMMWLALTFESHDAYAGRLAVPQQYHLADMLCAAANEGVPEIPSFERVRSEAAELMPEIDVNIRFTVHSPILERLHAAGLYIPYINRILLETMEPPVLMPFNLIHECMHASGFASEGAANCEAYRRCVCFRGIYAFSARIYALKLLCQTGGEDVRNYILIHLAEPARTALLSSGSLRYGNASAPAWMSRLFPGTGNYDMLLFYLLEHPERI